MQMQSVNADLYLRKPASFLDKIRRIWSIRAWKKRQNKNKTTSRATDEHKTTTRRRYVNRHGVELSPPVDMDYAQTIAFFESQGFTRIPETFTHLSANVVTTVYKRADTFVWGVGTDYMPENPDRKATIVSEPPKLEMDGVGIVVVKINQLNTYATYPGIKDGDGAGRFGIIATDINGKEVDYNTAVEIQLFDPNNLDTITVKTIYKEASLNKTRAKYYPPYPTLVTRPAVPKEISEYFKFDEGAILRYRQQQRWKLISPDVEVKNVEYYGTWDVWARESDST